MVGTGGSVGDVCNEGVDGLSRLGCIVALQQVVTADGVVQGDGEQGDGHGRPRAGQGSQRPQKHILRTGQQRASDAAGPLPQRAPPDPPQGVGLGRGQPPHLGAQLARGLPMHAGIQHRRPPARAAALACGDSGVQPRLVVVGLEVGALVRVQPVQGFVRGAGGGQVAGGDALHRAHSQLDHPRTVVSQQPAEHCQHHRMVRPMKRMTIEN